MSEFNSLCTKPIGCLFTKSEKVFTGEKQPRLERYSSHYSDRYKHYIPVLNYSKGLWKKIEAYAAVKSRHIIDITTCCVSVILAVRKLSIHRPAISVDNFTSTCLPSENSRQSVPFLANTYLLKRLIPYK